jgi:5-methyltetrahydrofolate--homocysteine methyltransferase
VDPVATAEVLAKKRPPAPFRPDTRFAKIRQAVLDGQEQEILGQVKGLLAQRVAPKDIIDQGMVAAMDTVNQSFKDGTVFIPEVLAAARAMNSAVRFLEPYLVDTDRRGGGKILIGTVRGDLHDIGKNMVATLLRGVGYHVIDLGINVAAEVFVQHVNAERPQILALSALLTTTMPEMGKVIGALSQAGIRESVKVIVGGAPVNQNFAEDIGADGYAKDAAEAVDLVRSLTR